MTLRLLTEHHLEFLSLKRGCIGLSESHLSNAPLLEILYRGSYVKTAGKEKEKNLLNF